MPETKDVILWNGEVMPRLEWHISPAADWTRYSPGFFESIRLCRGKIYFWDAHVERMHRGAAYWKAALPPQDQLLEELYALARESGIETGKLRIQFGVNVRQQGMDYLATVEAIEEAGDGYHLNQTGWSTGIYKERFKPMSEDSGYKSNRRDIYLLAQQWKEHLGYDEAIVINQQGRIADGTFTNVFWSEQGKWYTPPLHAFCVPGVMRQFLLEQSVEFKVNVSESDCYPERLIKADEIFMTNVIRGIRWVEVLHYNDDQYRFSNTQAEELFTQLSKWENELH